MKKLLYVFIGIAIALGAVVLYSFKAKENAEVSYVIIMGSRFTNKVSVYYDNGQEENAETLLDVKVGDNRDKGQLPFRNAVIKTLKHMTQKGYRVVGHSVNPGSYYYYTLIKEN
jgi:hypothetical protein